jgi:hypothetical protein
MTSSMAVPEPGALSIGTDGSMQGRTGSYDLGRDAWAPPHQGGPRGDLIADAAGMAQLVVADGNGGWTTRPNPDHIGYRMEAY